MAPNQNPAGNIRNVDRVQQRNAGRPGSQNRAGRNLSNNKAATANQTNAQRQNREALRTQRRQQRAARRAQRQQANGAGNQPRANQRALQNGGLNGGARLTQQQVRQGRFAAFARGQNTRANNNITRRAARIARRVAARTAWRRGIYASFVPWYGPVYWPYAYSDVFDYTFFPYAYDGGYWDYAYDDLFDGVYFPYGAPYAEDTYAGPYDGNPTATLASRETTGTARSSGTAGGAVRNPVIPGQVSASARDLCSKAGEGLSAWPFARIEKAVMPTDEQLALLDNVKKAATDAAEQFKSACPSSVPLTPAGRLEVITQRLDAMLSTVKLVRPPLEAFYMSLSDEQKQRFNEIGPKVGRDVAKTAQPQADRPPQDQQVSCGDAKTGLTDLPIEKIEDMVNPTDAQEDKLNQLDDAMQNAVGVLQTACPNVIPLTPVGRLEVMQKRLEAMISAAKTVQPALEAFYQSLDDEQKAAFNTLGRDNKQSAAQ